MTDSAALAAPDFSVEYQRQGSVENASIISELTELDTALDADIIGVANPNEIGLVNPNEGATSSCVAAVSAGSTEAVANEPAFNEAVDNEPALTSDSPVANEEEDHMRALFNQFDADGNGELDFEVRNSSFPVVPLSISRRTTVPLSISPAPMSPCSLCACV